MTKKPDIPPVMRSGLGGGSGFDANAILETPFGRRLVTTAACLIDSAAGTAAKYALHANRQDVLPRDVHLALMYESMHFLQKESLERDVEVMERELFGGGDQEDDDSDDDDSDDDDSEDDDTSSSETSVSDDEIPGTPPASQSSSTPPVALNLPEWTRSECECGLCRDVHLSEVSWDDWDPEDEAEKYLKITVQKTIDHA